jgi:hypothetical protein
MLLSPLLKGLIKKRRKEYEKRSNDFMIELN